MTSRSQHRIEFCDTLRRTQLLDRRNYLNGRKEVGAQPDRCFRMSMLARDAAAAAEVKGARGCELRAPVLPRHRGPLKPRDAPPSLLPGWPRAPPGASRVQGASQSRGTLEQPLPFRDLGVEGEQGRCSSAGSQQYTPAQTMLDALVGSQGMMVSE